MQRRRASAQHRTPQSSCVLYYSKLCRHCTQFTIQLQKKPHIKSAFRYIDVQKTRVPAYVKSVPTIVVAGINRPLVGSEVFQWLDSQSVVEKKGRSVGSIEPFSLEMDMGTGVNYTYLDKKDREQPMKGNCCFIEEGFQKINTPQEDNLNKASKITTKKRINYPSRKQPQHSGEMKQMPTGMQPVNTRNVQGGMSTEEALKNLKSRRENVSYFPRK